MDAGYTNAWFDVVVYENQVSHSWMLGNLESLKANRQLIPLVDRTSETRLSWQRELYIRHD
ncbi:hypothetical protein JHK82_048732 [Glycine max]|nr:hypothetical protein JHK86_048584 [Glycine max]KAG4944586.1 hypothetical protein JHK85_049232 [Glycine max]KAG5098878.1 hypothetical protein JHK82_048732 [Glycine max]KAG5103647.1 hypothetical protein JHK84_048616 [Glycine max]